MEEVADSLTGDLALPRQAEERLEERLGSKGRPELDHQTNRVVGGVPVPVGRSGNHRDRLAAADFHQPSPYPEGDGPGQDLEVGGLQRMDMLSPHEAAGLETGLEAQHLTAGFTRGPQEANALAVFWILDDLTAEGHSTDVTKTRAQYCELK